MVLLVDECVPSSVVELFRARGHVVRLVRELFPTSTPDPVIENIAVRSSATLVSWESDPSGRRPRAAAGGGAGNPTRRIVFRGNESRGQELFERWINEIEALYGQMLEGDEKSMIVEVRERGIRTSPAYVT
jgi:hypothetical protein